MTIFLFVFFLLMIIYGFIIESYRKAWNGLQEYIPDPQAFTVKVSVIIPLRNEEQNLHKLFEGLSQQNYDRENIEFIFVDDHSTDGSWDLLREFYEPDLTVMCIQLADGVTSKKRAIESGIACASGELIITTDADCIHHPGWINTIVSFYQSTGAKFIAAPVRMSGANNFLNIFQTLDVLTLQGITGAAISKRLHALCNGANLAYPRQVFFEVNGFEGIDQIPSGDDILFMQKVIAKYPGEVHYLKSKPAIVETTPEINWRNFFNQRIRWASKATHYEDKNIFLVLLNVYLVNFGFLVLFIASVINSDWWAFLLLFFLAKVIIEFPFVNGTAIFFAQQRLMKYFIPLQPIHIMYTIVAGWLGKFGSYRWKSRLVKNLGKSAG